MAEVRQKRRSMRIPDSLPVLPLRDVVVFPNIIAPLSVTRASSMEAVDAALSTSRIILLVSQVEKNCENPDEGDLYGVGTAGLIIKTLKLPDDRDVIRANAMTTFPQLLKASAHSAAMLGYLDQNTSNKNSPNQNYAREIMELHTLGVNGGYTQTDVAELSRVLTGWTLAGRGTFTFNAALHDYGAKTVIGTVIPAASTATGAAAQQEGETMLNVLVAHPSNATFISTKMLMYFLRYDPSPAQIAEVAAVYSSSGGDIKAMLRTVLSQQNLMAAPAMFKRPYHMIISALRSLAPNVTVTNIAGIAGQINAAGQYPFTWQTPDGFPTSLEYWSGNMLPRWNAASFVSNRNDAASIQFNVTPFMTPATPAAIVSQIDKYIFGGEITQRLRDELTTYITTTPTSATRVRETIALAMASSPFQYY